MFHPIKRWRGSSRRAKIISGIVTGLMVPALAFAATFFAFNLGVGGTVKAGSFAYTLGAPALFTSTEGLPAGQADICGGVTLNSDSKGITIAEGTGGLPGDTCKMHVPINADGNSTNGTISGLVLPGLPKGWTASLTKVTGGGDACGTTITPSSSLGTVLTIAVDPNASNGTFTGGTFDLGAGAIEVAPSAQAPASPVCTVTGTQ